MADEVDYHFSGVHSVTASEDGKFILMTTQGQSGEIRIAIPADGIELAIAMLLTAAGQASRNRGGGEIKAADIHDISIHGSSSNPDEWAIAISFQAGMAPLGLRLSRSDLIEFGLSALNILAPELLRSPESDLSGPVH